MIPTVFDPQHFAVLLEEERRLRVTRLGVGFLRLLILGEPLAEKAFPVGRIGGGLGVVAINHYLPNTVWGVKV
jgi:hypothetical protein